MTSCAKRKGATTDERREEPGRPSVQSGPCWEWPRSTTTRTHFFRNKKGWQMMVMVGWNCIAKNEPNYFMLFVCLKLKWLEPYYWSFVVFLHKTENTSTFGAIGYMLFPLCTDTYTHSLNIHYYNSFFKKTKFSVFEKFLFLFFFVTCN